MNAVRNAVVSTPRARSIVAGAAGAVVVWIGAGTGVWQLTPVVGLALGLGLGGREGFGAAAVSSFAGWAIPLAIRALSLSIGPTAAVVGGILGLGAHNGTVVIVATPILGALLGLAGAWIGTAARGMALAVYPGLRPASPVPTPLVPTPPAPRQPSPSRSTSSALPSDSPRRPGPPAPAQRTYPARRSGPSKKRKK